MTMNRDITNILLGAVIGASAVGFYDLHDRASKLEKLARHFCHEASGLDRCDTVKDVARVVRPAHIRPEAKP